MKDTLDFLAAALPWICIGLLLAIFFAQNARKKKDDKNKENYGTEGMALGMCFGVAIGTAFGNNTGIGLTLGMPAGLVIGTLIEKKENDEENMIEIMRVDKSNFTENSMDSFDRYQEVQNVFRMEDGRLVLKKQPFAETWSPERRREKAAEILSGEYITFCAFDGDTVVGEIMLLPVLNEARLIIDSFHVSRVYRRHGIGRRLVETACDYAKSRGAVALYASCCSAEETIRFYMAMGFEPSERPIPGCVKDEPFDIQMECRLI